MIRQEQGLGKLALIRSVRAGYDPKTVVIVGNGAVEGGSLPLRDAMKHEKGCENWIDQEFIICLARHSFQYRSLRNSFLLQHRRFNSSERNEVIEIAEPMLDAAGALRASVGDSYAKALMKNEISLRRHPIIEELRRDPSVAFITTNWDELLWNDSSIENLVQLHGRASLPDSLIFPSELSLDEIPYEICRPLVHEDPDPTLTAFEQPYRGMMRLHLRYAHIRAESWISKADNLLLWGCALNPYDAELLTILTRWTNPSRHRENGAVTVINPCPTDQRIALNLLLAPHPIGLVVPV